MTSRPEPASIADPDCIVWESSLVRIGAFRCHPDHPGFHDSGPAQNYCFVFPRTAVTIQHEHERAFVANPNIVTFYNKGQEYRRGAISVRGDHCDWFGVTPELVRDIDPLARGRRPEEPFRFTRAFIDPRTFLLQRRLFDRAWSGVAAEPLAMEEAVIGLLERVIRPALAAPTLFSVGRAQLDRVREVERILSGHWDEAMHLSELAREVETSVYHLCRTFRQVTGKTLHQYRSDLRVRTCLEMLRPGHPRLVDIAVATGYASHSHFTSAFRRAFGETPSKFLTAAVMDSRLRSAHADTSP